MRISYLVGFAGLVLSASSLGAQKTKKEAPKKVSPDESCTETAPGRVECIKRRGTLDSDRANIWRKFAEADSARMRRAALGMQLTATGSLRDTLGVFVSRVTPKGPAENAGIVEGDRIVSINGVDLRISAADVDDNYTNGLPSHRLTREVGKLAPGNRVNLRVYSGGRVRDVQVTAGRASDVFKDERAFGFEFGGPGMIYRGVPPGDLRIFHSEPGDMRIFRDDLPDMIEKMPKLDKKQLEEMKAAFPRLQEMQDKIRMIEPMKLEELRAKIRSTEPLMIRSLEPLRKIQPRLIRTLPPRTIRI